MMSTISTLNMTNFCLFKDVLSSIELWDDSLLCFDDLERFDGLYRKRKSHCGRTEVSYLYFPGSVENVQETGSFSLYQSDLSHAQPSV